MKALRVALLAVSAGLASPLFAGTSMSSEKNVLPQAAPAPLGCDWSGFHLGLNGGYAWGNSKVESHDGGFDESHASISVDPSGGTVGGQIGYDWQFNRWVFGLEIDGGWVGADEDKYIVPSPDNFLDTSYDWYAAFTPRLGYAFNCVLFYVKGGVAVVGVDTDAGDLIDGSRTIDQQDVTHRNDTDFAWTVGAGVEMQLWSNWSVKAEYDYFGMEDQSSSNRDGDHFNHENDMHMVKVGLNYRFGSFFRR